VDDRNAIGVVDDAHLQRFTVGGWTDEHGDVGIVGLEASPVVSKCVEHVVVGDTVLAGARLDVHSVRLRTATTERQQVLTLAGRATREMVPPSEPVSSAR
jgi:hypothetical protein